MLSIRKLEQEERVLQILDEETQDSSKKKSVTVMSAEEEEALINQINEIRERIRRGETAA
jgi:hypothetical protein